jgi:hypothetical protein
MWKRRRRAITPAGLVVAMMVLLLPGFAPPAEGGYTGKKGMGQPLTALEKARVQTAIDFIVEMAGLPRTSEKNAKSLEIVAACLQKMLDDGKICREGAADPDWDAICSNDGKKSWKGDAININPRLLRSGEVVRRALTAAMMHEGIHAMQCSTNRNEREWSAYSWEVYVLDKWQNEAFPSIPLTESRSAFERHRAAKASNRDAYCSAFAVDQAIEELRRLMRRVQRAFSIISIDRCWYTHLSGDAVIELHEQFGGDDEGTPLRALTSSFPVVTAVDVMLTLDGREALFVCGTDDLAVAGAIERFVDLDGDGLVDQESRLVLPGSFALPFDLDLDPKSGRAFVLDHAPNGVAVRLLTDEDGDGLPDTLRSDPFVASDAHPFLVAARSADVESPWLVSLSAWSRGQSYLDPGDEFFDAADLNGDGVADVVATSPSIAFQQPSRPVFFGDVQAGDAEVMVYAAPGTMLQVWSATEDGALIELLGAGFALDPTWRQPVSLTAPVALGQHLVAIAVDHPIPPGPPTPVAPPRPEVIDLHQEAVIAGQDVLLLGRNLFEDVTVTCGNVPAAIVAAEGTALIFTAPPVFQIPDGFAIVDVAGPGGSSPFVAVRIDGDCNGNGLPDPEEIAGGAATDDNGNHVPDECDPTCPDLDADGAVGFGDLLAVLAEWGPCEGCPTDLDYDGAVGFPDLLIVLAAWGPCP